jgi:hypothetical protein
MKRLAMFVVWAFALALPACSDRPTARETPSAPESIPEPIDPKYKEVSSLPVGLEVVHSPARSKAQRGGPSGDRYTWVYHTTVRALKEPVRIIEFGAFVRQGNRWAFTTHTGEPFTPDDFAEWYSCPGARLLPGKEYTDPSNWGGGNEIRAASVLWYFIGLDERGRKVKGEAVVEELAQLERWPGPGTGPLLRIRAARCSQSNARSLTRRAWLAWPPGRLECRVECAGTAVAGKEPPIETDRRGPLT